MKTLVNAFGQPFLTLRYDSSHGWLYCDWQGMLYRESVMEGGKAMLEAIEQNKCRCILNDNRHVTGPWSMGMDWISGEAIPKAVALGLQRFAHIVSPAAFAVASAEEMRQLVGSHFEMRLFDSETAAKEWLSEPGQGE